MWDCQEVLRHGCRAARASEACGCWSVMPEALNGAPLELRCLRQNQCRNISTPIAPCNAATCLTLQRCHVCFNVELIVTDSTELAKKSRLCFEGRGARAQAVCLLSTLKPFTRMRVHPPPHPPTRVPCPALLAHTTLTTLTVHLPCAFAAPFARHSASRVCWRLAILCTTQRTTGTRYVVVVHG